MTKEKLTRIKKTLKALPKDEFTTFADWLELLKTDRERALCILNEAERIAIASRQ